MRLIDADELTRKIDNFEKFFEGTAEEVEECENACDLALNFIDNEPTVDAVPVVHGHWDDDALIKANFLFRHSYHVVQLRCSKCERYAAELTDYLSMPEQFRYNFCPWCGAKMDENIGNFVQEKDGKNDDK